MNLSIRSIRALALSTLIGVSAVSASEVTIPNNFTANTPAVAAEVNENFGAVETAVDDNGGRIAALEAALAALQTTVTSQQTTITSLQANLAAVQSNSVLALDGILELGTDSKGYATARFTAVNVQIVNGLNYTFNKNGLGNLTIGYNETNMAQQLPFCSYGLYDNQIDCEANGETWAVDQRTGSHNLVLGSTNAYSQYGGLIAGRLNIVNGKYASVSGGAGNIASGNYSFVTGGDSNTASSYAASVSGGYENTASGDMASVSGGARNIASGYVASVSGGYENTASGDDASVSGGSSNTASGVLASVTGGYLNAAGGLRSSVSGGENTVIVPAGQDDWAAANLYEND